MLFTFLSMALTAARMGGNKLGTELAGREGTGCEFVGLTGGMDGCG